MEIKLVNITLIGLTTVVLMLLIVLMLNSVGTNNIIREQGKVLIDNTKAITSLNNTLIKGFTLSDERDSKYIDKLNGLNFNLSEMEASVGNVTTELTRMLLVIDKSIALIGDRVASFEDSYNR